VSPPATIIRIEFENTRPLVYADVLRESEQVRLDDWLRSQPRLLELVRHAIELERERAA